MPNIKAAFPYRFFVPVVTSALQAGGFRFVSVVINGEGHKLIRAFARETSFSQACSGAVFHVQRACHISTAKTTKGQRSDHATDRCLRSFLGCSRIWARKNPDRSRGFHQAIESAYASSVAFILLRRTIQALSAPSPKRPMVAGSGTTFCHVPTGAASV